MVCDQCIWFSHVLQKEEQLRITLLTTPRTAGNFYTGVLAEKYDIPDLGEYLHGLSTDDYLPLVHNMPIGIHKIFGNSLDRPSLNFVLANSDKVYYLIRKDKDAQLKSFLCAKHRHPGEPWLFTTEDTGDVIDIKVNKSEADIYRARFLRSDEVIKSYADRYPGEIKYTEDIIKDNYLPYTQKYNLTII